MAQAYTSDMGHKSIMVSKLGLLAAFNSCSWMLGPILGGFLATVYGNRLPWLLGSIGQHVNLLLLYTILPDTTTTTTNNNNNNNNNKDKM